MEPKIDYPDEDTAARLLKVFPGYCDGFVRVQPGNLMMPSLFSKDSEIYTRFKIRPDDTFVLSFPKSGTTWTQEMVWLIANDCDFTGAKAFLRERFPFLEDKSLATEESLKSFEGTDGSNEIFTTTQFVDDLPSPRFIKSHLPFTSLPSNLLNECKVVYVARNPKDVAVSWYHHHLLDPIMTTTLNFEEFVEYFMRDEVLYSPYWVNLIEAWNKRHEPNFLFLFYEDLKMDLSGQIEKVATFLGKELTPDQIQALVSHLSFDKFKANPSVNYTELQEAGYFKKDGSFIRKGQIGDWKNHFTAEQNSRFDQWIKDKTKDTDLKFPTFS